MEKILRETLANGYFVNVPERRSKTMSSIRGRNNKSTELRLRFGLVRAGISGWVIRPAKIIGHPDIYFPNACLAIFVDGCFWHGCPVCGHYPKTNAEFWKTKIDRNRQRDEKLRNQLKSDGFRVLGFWEHELQNDLKECLTRIKIELQRYST